MHLFTRKTNLTIRELTVFSVLGSIMFLSKIAMQWMPNVHLITMFIAVCTLTYRVRALIPLYVYILLDGVFAGFSMWWIPYLYIWLPLWAAVMLVSKIKMPKKLQTPLYMLLCGLHGLSFGTMYAPAQALMFGLSFKAMLAWIVVGFPFDVVHAVSDFASAVLVMPLYTLLKRLNISRMT